MKCINGISQSHDLLYTGLNVIGAYKNYASKVVARSRLALRFGLGSQPTSYVAFVRDNNILIWAARRNTKSLAALSVQSLNG